MAAARGVSARGESLTTKLLRYSLHLPVQLKALLLFSLVLCGSVLHAAELSPDSLFSDKNNPFNQYLVKLSWAWTLVCLLPIVLFSSFLYSALQWREIVGHFARIGTAHVIWFTVTSVFVGLDDAVGTCSHDEVSDRIACLKQGHMWSGFNISGHIFLLTYCVYLLTEECANIKIEVWAEYNNTLTYEHRILNKLGEKKKRVLPVLYQTASRFVESLELLATAEMGVWIVMVITTSLYFHTFSEKFLGFAFGYAAWYLTYRVLYGRSKFAPSRPDEGVLHPLHRLQDREHTVTLQ